MRQVVLFVLALFCAPWVVNWIMGALLRIPLMIGMQIITGAIGEELGWRGFLLSRLGKQIGVTASFWAMGILWSLWHLPALLSIPVLRTLT